MADTDAEAEAERLYAEHMLYFFNNCLHVYPGFSDPPGYRTIHTIKTRYSTQLFAEKVMPRLKDIWSDYDGSQWWCSPIADRRTNDETSFATARRSPDLPDGAI